MTWHFNEIVRTGNATARVKNYYPDTGLLVLYDIYGEIKAGSEIRGDDSGTVLTLNNFVIDLDYDLNYDPTYWSDPLPENNRSVLDSVIYDGNGNWVALQEHFTGLPSQDYQTTYLVVEG